MSAGRRSWQVFRKKPLQFLSVPVIAAGVGYVTNFLGVNMLFYPLEDNLSFKRWPDQPLGLFGWQGIVPCKRVTMATTLVDVSLARLLSISEIFARLDPAVMADILKHTMAENVLGGILPIAVVNFLLDRVAREIIAEIEHIVSIKEIVVVGLTTDASVLGDFFQKVGRLELDFLIDSGTYFGFLLGLLQMTQLILFPANWTLPISGATVGFLTNWIALQFVFKPIEPLHFEYNGTRYFTLQGFCLARQKEVSVTFSEYIASNVLTSEELWREMLHGSSDGKNLRRVISNTLPFLPSSVVDTIMATLRKELVAQHKLCSDTKTLNAIDKSNTSTIITNDCLSGTDKKPLHIYIDSTMHLEETLIERMNLLTPTEFERILHPVFEEDELTLIVAGGILGFFAGALQWWGKVSYENYKLAKFSADKLKISSPSSLSVNSTSKVVRRHYSSLRQRYNRGGGNIKFINKQKLYIPCRRLLMFMKLLKMIR